MLFCIGMWNGVDGWAHKANRWWYKVIIFMCLECCCVMYTFLWRVVCAFVIGASLASVQALHAL